jgi:hypothetical protein
MRRFVIIVPLLYVFAFTDALADESMQLTVKPLLCVTDNRNPSCDMSFLIVWESITTGYYCLFNDFADAPMRCWNEDRGGEATDERTVTQNFTYWMTGSDAGTRLAEVSVEVLRLDSDDRRRRRRTRHVWDIN